MLPPVFRVVRALSVVFAVLAVACFVSHLRSERLIEATARRIDAGRALGPAQRLVAYVDFASHQIPDPGLAGLPSPLVRAYYRFNPLHPGPSDVLRWGSDFRGPCGSRSRVVVAMLQRRRVPSRLLLLLDRRGHSIHTVVEARVDGRWAVADPTFGIVFRRRDGSPATSQDLASDAALFRACTAAVGAYPPEYRFDRVAHANWNKVPVVMPALRTVLVAVLGERRVEEISVPTVLWGRPRAMLGLACMFASLAFAAVSTWTGLRIPAQPMPAEELEVLLPMGPRVAR